MAVRTHVQLRGLRMPTSRIARRAKSERLMRELDEEKKSKEKLKADLERTQRDLSFSKKEVGCAARRTARHPLGLSLFTRGPLAGR